MLGVERTKAQALERQVGVSALPLPHSSILTPAKWHWNDSSPKVWQRIAENTQGVQLLSSKFQTSSGNFKAVWMTAKYSSCTHHSFSLHLTIKKKSKTS